ncbi:hypothetical protein [Paenibacillus sp. UASWS1643]|uniref:hypothetical protein n=2 Tax=Bacteria TaxID=2 RepID=UPI0016846F39|nr:hypothetical protein [Paenibacillus sp. UASWS1643]
MDFVSDWHDIIIGDIEEKGLRYSRTTPKELLVIKYFTYLRKTGGTPHPRRVHRSNEFVCPSHLQNGLSQLIHCLENGTSISPYFSRAIDDISKIDRMFNDWGVLHLHLGDKPDQRDQRLIERTGPLLFLYLQKDDAYLINVYWHGDWTDRSILQTMYDNWPELIEPYILKSLKKGAKLVHQLTENELHEARGEGSLVLQELTDENGFPFVIIPPTFGMTTSRDASQDVSSYDKFVELLLHLESHFKKNHELFEGNIANPLRLKLIRDIDNMFYVVEQSTGTIIK